MNTNEHGVKGLFRHVYPCSSVVKILFVIICGCSAQAERFLTVDQALRVCFPKATSFSVETFKLERKKELRVWTARQDADVLGFLLPDHVIGKHDFIDYAVAVSTNGAVLQVEILEYREHYGGQVRLPKWREQFVGKTAAAPLKLNHDIYNITGATLSCRHVTEGVKRLLVAFDRVRARMPAFK